MSMVASSHISRTGRPSPPLPASPRAPIPDSVTNTVTNTDVGIGGSDHGRNM